MNVVLLVVDSLRAASLDAGVPDRPRTPFLDRLGDETLCFSRAYATECWTLPSHASLFTGLLPSEHGAHFQYLDYAGKPPTIAELLAEKGFHTELVSRNSIFDGSIPGIVRGFRANVRVARDRQLWSPAAILFALTKPRFRRQIRESGFFHPAQRENLQFLARFVSAMFPADRPLLGHVLERMQALQRRSTPYFLFANLYDVHAPYCPSDGDVMRPVRSLDHLAQNLHALGALSLIGSHAYLREGFRMPEASRRALRERYHRAIELMDAKLAEFHAAAQGSGLLDDTLLIVTSDHGEAFGEHDLYLHDASLFDVNLRVPLWIQHPRRAPERIDDVVSVRALFDGMRAVALDEGEQDTLLDADHRERHPVALAEHFHYPGVPRMKACYRQNLVAAICGDAKLIARGGDVELYDLAADPLERAPHGDAVGAFAERCALRGRRGAPLRSALRHVQEFRERFASSRSARAGHGRASGGSRDGLP